MRRPRQYQRRLKLVNGAPGGIGIGSGVSVPFTIDSYAGSGPRVAFTVERNNRGESDRAFIDIYNLNEKFREGMKADMEKMWESRREIQATVQDDRVLAQRLKAVADSYRVNLFVGYGNRDDDLTLLMRGDLIDVIPSARRGGLDTITRIELGDTLMSMRDNYLNGVFGTGATMSNVLRYAAEAAALKIDKSSEREISILAGNAVVTKLEGGYVARGRVADTIAEIADQYGLQWWVSDGTLFFVAQGATLQDFTIQLRDGRDMLDFTERSSYNDVTGRALLNANIVPGRGLILQGIDGKPLDNKGFRVNTARYMGDTRGAPWWVDFEATTVSNSQLSPTIELRDSDYTDAERLEVLERKFPKFQK